MILMVPYGLRTTGLDSEEKGELAWKQRMRRWHLENRQLNGSSPLPLVFHIRGWCQKCQMGLEGMGLKVQGPLSNEREDHSAI